MRRALPKTQQLGLAGAHAPPHTTFWIIQHHLGQVDKVIEISSPLHPMGRDAASAGLVRGLQHGPPVLQPAHALAPRVPQSDCLNPSRWLSGQTGCIPPSLEPVKETECERALVELAEVLASIQGC